MKTRMLEPHVASVTVADLMSLFLVLAVASGIALGCVAVELAGRGVVCGSLRRASSGRGSEAPGE